MVTLLAHLTDTHVVDPDCDEELYVDNNARVAAAVAAVNAESPRVAAVVATGDLTQWGTPVEFELLRTLLAPLVPPVLALAGNHDERDGIRASFPDLPWADADHASWVVDVDGIRIVGLDTTLPGEPGGEFDDARDEWLRATLAVRHAGPTLLAMHHPPFLSGIEWMDRAGFVGLDRLAVALADVGGVDRILCGHLHRPITSTIAGIPAEVGPATTVHVALDLRPGADVRIVRDPPAYRILRVDGDTVVAHTRYIDRIEHPFPPAWASPQ